MIKVYHYPNCSNCRKALAWLDRAGIAYKPIHIVEQPPSRTALKKMLTYQQGAIRKLFNTSGMQYRELNLKDKLPGMIDADALALLAGNGMLIKRPFVLGEGFGLLGFKVDEWAAQFE